MSIQFTISQQQNVSIISLEGRILSEADLDSIKQTAENTSAQNFVFDLSKLTHTNSSGIAFIIRIMTRARINGGDVVLSNPNPGIQKLIDISKLYEVFSIYPSKEDAINHFNK
jgi:anti-sigma B factor antagonist